MGLVEYNFGGIEGGAQELQAAVAKTLGLLEEGQAALGRLQAAWQGEGSMSWQSVQTRWDSNSNEINEALQKPRNRRQQCWSDHGQHRKGRGQQLSRVIAPSNKRDGARGWAPGSNQEIAHRVRRTLPVNLREVLMSADYDRLFHSPDAVRTVDDDGDRDTPPAGRDSATPPPMPVAPPRTQAAPAPPPRETEVTSQIPPTQSTGPQRIPNNGMMRTSQSAPSGARHEQPRYAPAPAPRPAPAPAPSQHFADGEADRRSAAQPAPTSAASMGNHRAIDALVARRVSAVRGEDAVAARLATLALHDDPHQPRALARRDVRDGSARPDPPKCPRLLPDRRVRAQGRRRQDGGHGGARIRAQQDPRRPDPRDRRRSRRRQPRRPCRASVRGDDRRSVVRQGTAPVQRHPRVHEHERLEPRGALLRGVQRRAPRVQRRGLAGRDGHRVALLQPGARRLRGGAVPAGRARRAVDGVRVW